MFLTASRTLEKLVESLETITFVSFAAVCIKYIFHNMNYIWTQPATLPATSFLTFWPGFAFCCVRFAGMGATRFFVRPRWMPSGAAGASGDVG